MKNEEKVWLVEQCSHKTWTISLALAQEAARAGRHGRGYAVVAHETRNFADRLCRYAKELKFGLADCAQLKSIGDFAFMLKFLALNAALESFHMASVNMDFNIPKSMAVLADELRNLAMEMSSLSAADVGRKPFAIPELASTTDKGESFFLMYSIGGHHLMESLENVAELCHRDKSDLDGDSFTYRGASMPIINLYPRLSLPQVEPDSNGKTVMLIRSDDGAYAAVPIDDLDVDAILCTRPGISAAINKDHAFANHARECWDLVGGGQVAFVDWQKAGSGN